MAEMYADKCQFSNLWTPIKHVGIGIFKILHHSNQDENSIYGASFVGVLQKKWNFGLWQAPLFKLKFDKILNSYFYINIK